MPNPTVNDALLEAFSYHQAGRLQEAEQLYRAVLQAVPQHPDAHHNLGMIAIHYQKPFHALPHFKAALEANPGKEQFWLSYMDILIQTEQWEIAEELFTRGAEAHIQNPLFQKRKQEIKKKPSGLPNDKDSQYMLATHLHQLGKAQAAYSLLSRLVDAYPDYVDAYITLATWKREAGEFEEALSLIEKVMARHPHHPKALQLHFIVLGQLKRLEESAESIKKFLKIEPRNIEALVLSAHYKCLNKDYDAAKNLLMEALQYEPSSVLALTHLARLFQELDQINEALAIYQKIETITPNNHEVAFSTGLLLRQRQYLSLAVEQFRKAWTFNPRNAYAFFYLVNTLLEAMEYDEAERLLKENEATFGTHPDYVLQQYNLAAKRKDWAAAWRYLEECRKHYPDAVTHVGPFIPALVADNRIEEANDLYLSLIEKIRNNAQEAGATSVSTRPITALITYGRAGSMFLHSLLDGHQELLTVPGIYLRGWFDPSLWNLLSPDLSAANWKDILVRRILHYFQPLFDASNRQNVPGQPCGYTTWLAKTCGFTEMGPDKSQLFRVDQEAFAKHFHARIAPLSHIDVTLCFELLHEAFAHTVRPSFDAKEARHMQIFYHAHNPVFEEILHFLGHYPAARFLFIVRHPLQNLESRLLNDFEDGMDEVMQSDPDTIILSKWMRSISVIKEMLFIIQSPLFITSSCRAVKLEDIKRHPKTSLPRIAHWMGIADHPSLYESNFCGMQYWGPASKITASITGFDTKAIDSAIGRALGPRDVTLFETLLWPFSKLFGYTDMDESHFKAQLETIRPWIDEPLQYEENLYQQLQHKPAALRDMHSYKSLHSLLLERWEVLRRDGTYKAMLQPLDMICEK